MSVVVRMEMPTSCEECPLVQTDENDWGDVMSRTCNLIYKGYLSDVPKGERRADCPIICALPENHGRLVDADALNRKRKHLIKTENGVFPKSEWFIKANDLFAAKTIVPAERSEHEQFHKAFRCRRVCDEHPGCQKILPSTFKKP